MQQTKSQKSEMFAKAARVFPFMMLGMSNAISVFPPGNNAAQGRDHQLIRCGLSLPQAIIYLILVIMLCRSMKVSRGIAITFITITSLALACVCGVLVFFLIN